MLEKKRREVLRLYGLTDRWLAAELQRQVRLLRAAFPRYRPWERVYDSVFLWHFVPEVARRLGARSFNANERTDRWVVTMSDRELRCAFGQVLANLSPELSNPALPGSILANDVEDGNPVVFGLDRICVPVDMEGDLIARRLRAIAGARKVACNGVWTPEMIRASA